ncbi:transketolase [Shumkonia mesophila]|uniref:transketolase n=1 Tax=Shumkonia mesophila TaxID=2838854 RepID=UPI00293479B0|nr:transketolase [Shumkonia mesophila]
MARTQRVVPREADVSNLEAVATRLRRKVIDMTTEAGSGHPTSCLSCADLVAALFFSEMRWDPSAPDAVDTDTFVLSKGHAAPILWAVLSEAGVAMEPLSSLRRFGSTLEGHPTPSSPWVKVSTGSLGQGLPVANGIALANRMDRIDADVFCLLGDGECAEGAVWEAAQFASANGLSSVVAIVDVNGLGQTGSTAYGRDTGVFARRFEAFGWSAIEIDGHDMHAIRDALFRARSERPAAILARTVKGKGVSFLEDALDMHGKPLDAGQREKALEELGDPVTRVVVMSHRVGGGRVPASSNPPPIEISYEPDAAVATRAAFGTALAKLGTVMPDLVVIDGDVGNSTGTLVFAKDHAERFVQAYIAEQNMAGVAMGLAACGKRPVVASFAAFLTRAADFIRMASHSQLPHLVFCGSHVGVSIGEDGPSQMGLEDLSLFRALGHSTVLYPADAVGAERLTEQAVLTPGIVYLRTSRPKTPVLYPNDAEFPVGGSKTLRTSYGDAFTIVAAGITVFEALAAHDQLKERGIATRVIDAYSVKPLDGVTLAKAAAETRGIVVVEDHWIDGGLGDAVAAELAQTGYAVPVRRLAIIRQPQSGDPRALIENLGISTADIVREITRMSGEPNL